MQAGFDPNMFAWLPGTAFGCLGGLWGSLAGVLAPKGRARGLVLGFGWGLLVLGVLLLVAAVVAWALGQPYGVWYGLGLPGVIVPIVLGVNLPMVRAAYRRAEERKLSAGDL